MTDSMPAHPIFDQYEHKKDQSKVKIWSYVIDHPIIIIRSIVVILSFIPVLSVQNKFTITDDIPMNTQNGVVIANNGVPRPIVANNFLEMTLLLIARSTAFLMYVDLVLVFLVKCRASMNLLYQTPLSTFLPDDLNDQHNKSGTWICWCALIHTVTHCIRWIISGNFNLLVKSQTGITGLITVIFLPLITVIMMKSSLKSKISYELRKGLHYLFYLFALILCLHAPCGYIGVVMGLSLFIYVVDTAYVWIFMTEKTSTRKFQVLANSGVQMVFTVSEPFQRRLAHGGHLYICFPWISRFQYLKIN